MKKFNFIGAVVVSLTMTGQMAQAQAVPAEFPPASFTDNQYIDSRGCAFVRAGLSGTTKWVPRLSRTREQLCNFQPSLAQQTAPVRAAAAPNPLAGLPDATVENSSPIDAPAVARTRAPAAPRVAAAPASRATGDVGAPIQTVASVTTSPRLIQPIATATPPVNAPTPRVITAPAPVAARRITLAEACAGLFGVQRGFVSAQTGDPINCGPAPAATPTVAPNVPVAALIEPPAPAQPRITLAAACLGRFGLQERFISAQTGDPINCGPAPVAASVVALSAPTTPEPRRLTLAQACAEIASTGRPLTNAVTGLQVSCAPQPQPNVQPRVFAGLAGPATPAGPATVAAPLAPTINAPVAATVCDRPGARYLMAGNGLPVRCGPQAQSPSSTQGVQVTRRATAPASATIFGGSLFGDAPIPASNPRIYRDEPVRPPSGYERVWGDGRLNTQRGLPRALAAPVSTLEARVVTRNTAPRAVAPETPNGHRFVQVGSFGDIGNAQATIRRLQGMGMPISTGRSGSVQVVAIGPFSNGTDLQRALQVARGAGYTDAYTRN